MSVDVEILSDFLAQRTSILQDGAVSGKYVLYWMKHAARAHENPALDVSLQLADELSLPLLVYQQIAENELYASDRRFAFEIEGAGDVQKELLMRSIDYLFWVQKNNAKSLLENLAEDAAIIVAEDMPVPSERFAKQRLVEATSTPIWLVDTACIVPMQVAGKAYTRAFSYRSATAKERSERVKATYNEVDINPKSLPKTMLDVEKISLAKSNLKAILSGLEIDHDLEPVSDTTGGSVAGYRRWHSFVKNQLPHYQRDRNDPLLDPSSRMSAYLKVGHVSPFLIAREAAISKAAGAYKFLDELLVWRELSYTFCRYTPELETLNVLPDWAAETLRKHEEDERPQIYSYEDLYFAKTDDPLWNAAQLSLLTRGELHNNVRMTWGKAIAQWTRDAQEALTTMISLNHRLALDGNDPSSYGGLLWCLGQFDRPFPPERPILGLVRERSTSAHAKRLDVEKYLALIQA